jgi:hypothetical protein
MIGNDIDDKKALLYYFTHDCDQLYALSQSTSVVS